MSRVPRGTLRAWSANVPRSAALRHAAGAARPRSPGAWVIPSRPWHSRSQNAGKSGAPRKSAAHADDGDGGSASRLSAALSMVPFRLSGLRFRARCGDETPEGRRAGRRDEEIRVRIFGDAGAVRPLVVPDTAVAVVGSVGAGVEEVLVAGPEGHADVVVQILGATLRMRCSGRISAGPPSKRTRTFCMGCCLRVLLSAVAGGSRGTSEPSVPGPACPFRARHGLSGQRRALGSACCLRGRAPLGFRYCGEPGGDLCECPLDAISQCAGVADEIGVAVQRDMACFAVRDHGDKSPRAE